MTRPALPRPEGKIDRLMVSRGTHLLVLTAQRQIVAEHALSTRHGTTVLIQEHYATLRRKSARTTVVLAEQFLARFPRQRPFLDGLIAQHKLNPADHLRPVLELADVYDAASLEHAFAPHAPSTRILTRSCAASWSRRARRRPRPPRRSAQEVVAYSAARHHWCTPTWASISACSRPSDEPAVHQGAAANRVARDREQRARQTRLAQRGRHIRGGGGSDAQTPAGQQRFERLSVGHSVLPSTVAQDPGFSNDRKRDDAFTHPQTLCNQLVCTVPAVPAGEPEKAAGEPEKGRCSTGG